MMLAWLRAATKSASCWAVRTMMVSVAGSEVGLSGMNSMFSPRWSMSWVVRERNSRSRKISRTGAASKSWVRQASMSSWMGASVTMRASFWLR